jgi:hypothetical protein
MIDKEFAQHLKLEPLGMPYTKSVSYVDRQVEYETTMVKVELVGQDTQFTYRLAAETVENFQQHCHLTNWSKEKEKFSYLQGISVPSSPEECTAAMLIGVDNSFLFRITETVTGGWTEPIANLTPLGWAFMGNKQKFDEKQQLF